MPEHLAPGVYVEEMPSPPPPIQGVPTATAALVGETERGPLRPRLVTSAVEYARWYGGACGDDRYLPAAVAGFFGNGGMRAFVVRVTAAGAAVATGRLGPLIVEAAGPGAWGNRVWARIVGDSGTNTFRLRLAYWQKAPAPPFDPFDEPVRMPRPQLLEEHSDLSLDVASPGYFGQRSVGADGRPSSPLAVLRAAESPDAVVDWPPGALLGGGSDGAGCPTAGDYRGMPAGLREEPQGLTALAAAECDEVALVCAPFPCGESLPILRAVVEHCEQRRFRFAIVDADPATAPLELYPRDAASGLGETTRAAFYAPWIVITNPTTATSVAVPPSGHVLGVYARTDRERGVHTAPANQVVRGATAVATPITHEQQDVLNSRGVNAIRQFGDRGILVWGARTLSQDGDWKYISVRRHLLFLERSIQEGTHWAVFEPNAEPLWARLREAVEQFLLAQWRSGALQGRTVEQAFFVRCDRTTMTQGDIDAGRLVCLVGVAQARPAEFVIFRIGHETGHGA